MRDARLDRAEENACRLGLSFMETMKQIKLVRSGGNSPVKIPKLVKIAEETLQAYEGVIKKERLDTRAFQTQPYRELLELYQPGGILAA